MVNLICPNHAGTWIINFHSLVQVIIKINTILLELLENFELWQWFLFQITEGVSQA